MEEAAKNGDRDVFRGFYCYCGHTVDGSLVSPRSDSRLYSKFIAFHNPVYHNLLVSFDGVPSNPNGFETVQRLCPSILLDDDGPNGPTWTDRNRNRREGLIDWKQMQFINWELTWRRRKCFCCAVTASALR